MAALTIVAGVPVAAQDPASPVSAAARLLTNTTPLRLPDKANKKFKVKIAKKATMFSLPFGQSPAVLVHLPAFKVPYTLAISSDMKGKFGRLHVFVPTIAVLDANFTTTRELAETTFRFEAPSWSYGARLMTVVSVDEANAGDRYLMIFTDPRGDGERLGSFRADTPSAPLLGALIPVRFSRALAGELIIELQPR